MRFVFAVHLGQQPCSLECAIENMVPRRKQSLSTVHVSEFEGSIPCSPSLDYPPPPLGGVWSVVGSGGGREGEGHG